MTKQPYGSKHPGPDGRYAYSPEEDAVWGDLFDRQMAFLPGRVTPDYLDGVRLLGLTRDHVPQIADIDARLAALTGAGVEGVPAIIPPSRFFDLLSRRRFPVATFLRRREDMDYIEEPDLFHEVFGHCPLLTNPAYADFVERFGKIAVQLGKPYSWRPLPALLVHGGVRDDPHAARPARLRRRHRLLARPRHATPPPDRPRWPTSTSSPCSAPPTGSTSSSRSTS